MPVELEWVEKEDLTIFRLKGKVSVQEIKESILTFYHEKPTRYVLWDTREGDIAHMTDHNVRYLVQTATRLLPSKKNGKTAIIATEDLNIKIASMAEIFSEVFRQKNPIKMFESPDEANNWLFERRG